MTVVMEEDVKMWTAKRKAALVTEIIQGKTISSGGTQRVIKISGVPI